MVLETGLLLLKRSPEAAVWAEEGGEMALHLALCDNLKQELALRGGQSYHLHTEQVQ